MRRLIFFVGVSLASITLPWWAVLPLWAVYALAYTGYELVVLGILLDAYFGYSAGGLHIFYTAAAAGICILATLIKPRIAWYHDERS